MRRSRLLVPLLAASLLTGASLTGCSAVDNVVGGVVDEAERQVQEQIDRTVSEALGGASISRDGKAPDGFPAEAVPLVDGEIEGGAGGPGGSGWAVQLKIDGIDRFEEAGTLLTDAGYTGTISNADATSGFGTWTGPEYTVTITVSGVSGESGALTALYVVVPAG